MEAARASMALDTDVRARNRIGRQAVGEGEAMASLRKVADLIRTGGDLARRCAMMRTQVPPLWRKAGD
jgi:hypothetical protein